MSNRPPHAHDPKKPADETPRPPTSDEQLKSFWIKNEKTVYIACLVVILVVAGVSIFRNMQKANEDNVGAAYAAADTPEKLRAFIAAHPSDILASAAELRLADEAYQAKNYTAAAASYEKAAASKTAPFAGRALMGAAMSKILTGQTAEGETRLKQISNDTTQLPIIRGEATYHLATLAASAGQSAEALKLYKQVAEIAPATIWDENAAYQSEHLSASTAAPAAAQPATAQPASSSPEMPTIRFPQ